MKEITFKYYGQLTDLLGMTEESTSLELSDTASLRESLIQRHPVLEQHSFTLAQNNRMLHETDEVSATQVDVFPPFSGG